jgi:hypothetical protein
LKSRGNTWYLATRMVNAVGPIHLGPTVIERVHALVQHGVSNQFLLLQIVLAYHDLCSVRRSGGR